jgi:hypothetical protein
VMKGTFGWYEGQAIVQPLTEGTKQRMIERFLAD